MRDLECLTSVDDPHPDDLEAAVSVVKGVVEANYGIKAVDLVVRVLSITKDFHWKASAPHVPKLIDRLVQQGALVELQVILPTSTYKVRSLYFPADTVLKETPQVKPILFS